MTDKFVDQRDVEVALGVLDDLGGLGHLAQGLVGRVSTGGDDAGVERVDAVAASGVEPLVIFLILVAC